MASRGGEGHGFALAEARHAQASGPDAKTFMPWLRAYKLAAAQSTPPGAPDPRVEPAINLCAYDFTKPALELLRDSPEIAGLHYALLGADLMNGRRFDKARLDELSRRLAEARYDRRYGILRSLLAGAFRRIRHEIVAGSWVVTYTCYPLSAFESQDYWILDTANDLDTDTILA